LQAERRLLRCPRGRGIEAGTIEQIDGRIATREIMPG
jgi:hypothetical protein